MLIAVQLFAAGLYLPPVLQSLNVESTPPQTSISLPLQIDVCANRPSGAFAVVVAVQIFVVGLYLPPVFNPIV